MKAKEPLQRSRSFAVFVSPHGFGHAARATAIMAAIREREPRSHFHIYTKVPAWFFAESIPGAFTYHDLLTDIGVVQQGPMQEDLPATIRALDELLPFDPARVQSLAGELRRLECEQVLCDIAPLGIAVATAAGIPSVLIENFTWDWIYTGYLEAEPRFERHIQYLRAVFQSASTHIQTAPVCAPAPSAHLVATPIGRSPLTPPAEVRLRLGISEGERMVLVTMGGIPQRFDFIEQLPSMKGIHLVIPGGSKVPQFTNQLALLPHHSNFYHPDLIHASDVVIGKAGYSTIAETYHAGAPFGYVVRPGWRESGPLADFIASEMPGLEIPVDRFESGDLKDLLPALLALPARWRSDANGSLQAADIILQQAPNNGKHA